MVGVPRLLCVPWRCQVFGAFSVQKKSTIYSIGRLAGAWPALRCWLCSASADVMMGHVYGARLVAVLVAQ